MRGRSWSGNTTSPWDDRMRSALARRRPRNRPARSRGGRRRCARRVSLPPQTQPVSRHEQVVALDQAERRPVAEGDRHAGAAPARARRTTARKPGGAASAPSLVANSSVPSAATKRIRVSVLSVKRSRSSPASESLQRVGSLPNICARNSRGGRSRRFCSSSPASASVVGQVPLRNDAGVEHQPALLVHRHAARRAPRRATLRGRARRGCRRACRCGGAAARRRRRRAGASRGCRGRRSPPRRGRAGGAAWRATPGRG